MRSKTTGGAEEATVSGTGGEGSGGEAAVYRGGVRCVSPAVVVAPDEGTSGVAWAMGVELAPPAWPDLLRASGQEKPARRGHPPPQAEAPPRMEPLEPVSASSPWAPAYSRETIIKPRRRNEKQKNKDHALTGCRR